LIHLFNRKSYHISRFKNASFREVIYSILGNNTFDVILFESIFSAGFIEDIKTRTNAKLIYRAHNVEHKIWEDLSKGESNPFKKWYLNDLSKTLKSFEVNFLEKVDLIFSISSVDQLFFKEFTRTESQYIPVSMITQNREVLIKNSLCFLGAFNWKPNKEGLMWFANHVFIELQALVPGLRLEVAGSFSEEIKALSNRKHIELHGFVESSLDFIQNNGIFIAPLLSGSGVKMKVLEAMSLGVPCVISSKASEGLNLPPIIPICRNKKEFIEKLYLLLNDDEMKIEIGKAGKEFIKREFSSELVSLKIKQSIQLENN
jgi:glycosyltransferase involved in cell wall biosynthesis